MHVREWALARNICEQIVYVPPSLLPKNQKHACHTTFVGCLQYLPLPPILSLSDCSIQILLKCRFDCLWCLAQVTVTVTVTKCFMARALMWLSDKHSTMQHLPMKVVHSGSGLGLGLGLCMCIYTYKGRGVANLIAFCSHMEKWKMLRAAFNAVLNQLNNYALLAICWTVCDIVVTNAVIKAVTKNRNRTRNRATVAALPAEAKAEAEAETAKVTAECGEW